MYPETYALNRNEIRELRELVRDQEARLSDLNAKLGVQPPT